MSNHSRSRTRKFLYQMLYASAFGKISVEEFKESFYSGVFEASLDEEYLKNMYDLIITHEYFLISIIKRYAPKFKIEDMDLSYVLPVFIGVTEIFYYSEEIPLKVSINEAVEISKVYGDDPSRKMVNGVLFNVSKDIDQLMEESKNYQINPDEKLIFSKN